MSQSGTRFPVHNSLPLPSSVGQIDGLQLMRAIAVALVAWGHSGILLPEIQGKTLPGYPVFGVDIFFVISGFILSWIVLKDRSNGGPATAWKFLKRRLLRIFPIYWIFCLLAFTRLFLSHRPLQRGYLPCFFLVPPLHSLHPNIIVGSSWTLFFEMVFYYLITLLLLGAARRAIPCAAAIVTAAVLLGLLFNIRRPVLIILFNPILLEFALGAGVAMAYHTFGRRRLFGILCTATGLIVFVFLILHPFDVAASMQDILADKKVLQRIATWGVAAMLLVCGVVFWSPSLASLPGRVAVALGNASYSIYLASAWSIEYVNRLEYKVAGRPASWAGLIVYQEVIFLCVMGLGWLCYDLIEWPVLQILQKKLLRR